MAQASPFLVIALILLPSLGATQTPVSPDWRDLGIVLHPGPSGSFDETAVKDPSVVFFEGAWHVFYTARGQGQYTTGYVSAPELSKLADQPHHELKQIRGARSRYACAPQVFFFEPQRKWYLVLQTKEADYQPVFATTDSISDPTSWSEPQRLLEKDDDAKWIDFWVICDAAKAYLFYTRKHDEIVVRSTSLEQFPLGWSPGETVFSGVHEAVHVYKAKGTDDYHLLYELSNGGRSFGLARAQSLEGPWEKVTDEYATGGQLTFSPGALKWTEMTSHGEFLRIGYNQLLEYDPQRPALLIQGLLKSEYKGDYSALPWRLGLIEGSFE